MHVSVSLNDEIEGEALLAGVGKLQVVGESQAR